MGVNIDGPAEIQCDNQSVVFSNKRYAIDATTLSKQWGIPLHMTKTTLDATTQRGVRDFTKLKGTKRLRSSHTG